MKKKPIPSNTPTLRSIGIDKLFKRIFHLLPSSWIQFFSLLLSRYLQYSSLPIPIQPKTSQKANTTQKAKKWHTKLYDEKMLSYKVWEGKVTFIHYLSTNIESRQYSTPKAINYTHKKKVKI